MEISTQLPENLLSWYDKCKRSMPWRDDPTPYHVWLSEIMLQQTRVEAVRSYYQRFIEVLPNIALLANADEETLLKLWEGLGYYRRVYNLQKAAQVIVDQYGGELPSSYDALRSLPGIGDYTAGAISSIAFGLPKAAVDGNVLRVISRIMGDDRDITGTSIKKEVAQALEEIYPKDRCGDFTQSLMELGALVCIPNGAPLCDVCPLREMCYAQTNHCVDEFPVKPNKKQRRIEHLMVLILQNNDRFAIQKRTEPGLLQGLWQLPNFHQEEDPHAIDDFLEKQGVSFDEIKPIGSAKHIFSHVEWHMTGYYISCSNQSKQFRWATPKEITEEISLPAAFQYFSKHWTKTS